jgi:hypothetical protein
VQPDARRRRRRAGSLPGATLSSKDCGLDALSLLAAIRDRLIALRPTVIESRSELSRRDAVVSALDAIAEVDAIIERNVTGAA